MMKKKDLLKLVRGRIEEGFGREEIKALLVDSGFGKKEAENILNMAEAEVSRWNPEEGRFSKERAGAGKKRRKNLLWKRVSMALFLFLVVGGASFYLYKRMTTPSRVVDIAPAGANIVQIEMDEESGQVENLKSLLTKFPYYEDLSKKVSQRWQEEKKKGPLSGFDFSLVDDLAVVQFSEAKEEERSGLIVLSSNSPEKLGADLEKLKHNLKQKEKVKFEKNSYRGVDLFLVKEPRKTEDEDKEEKLSPIAPPFQSLPRPPEIGGGLWVASLEGKLLVGFQEKDLKRTVDVWADKKLKNLFKKNKKRAVSDTSRYEKLAGLVPEERLLFLYGKPEVSPGGLEKEGLEEQGLGGPTASRLGLASLLSPSGRVAQSEKTVVAFTLRATPDKLISEMAALDLGGKSRRVESFEVENSIASSFPRKFNGKELFYFSEGKDLKGVFDELKKGYLEKEDPPSEEEFEEFSKEFEETTGVSLEEDLLSLVESNFALFMAGEKTGTNPPSLGLVFEDEKGEAEEVFSEMRLPSLEEQLEQNRERTKDRRATSYMTRLRSNILLSSDPAEKSLLLEEIKEQTGSEPVVWERGDKYCAYVDLNEKGASYCISSGLYSLKTYKNPAFTCNGRSFRCPEEGEAPERKGMGEITVETFEKKKVRGEELYSLPLGGGLELSLASFAGNSVLTLEEEDAAGIRKKHGRQDSVLSLLSARQSFKEAPEELTSISYLRPAGFLDAFKATVSLYRSLTGGGETLGALPSETKPSSLFDVLFELIDRGVKPFFKVTASSFSYSYREEEGVWKMRGETEIKELSEEEEKKVEKFWENVDNWLKEKTGIPFQTPSSSLSP